MNINSDQHREEKNRSPLNTAGFIPLKKGAFLKKKKKKKIIIFSKTLPFVSKNLK